MRKTSPPAIPLAPHTEALKVIFITLFGQRPGHLDYLSGDINSCDLYVGASELRLSVNFGYEKAIVGLKYIDGELFSTDSPLNIYKQVFKIIS